LLSGRAPEFLKLSAAELEIDNIVCEISSLMTENIKFTTFLFPHQSMHAMRNHLSTYHNLKASPFRAIRVFKDTIIEKWRWLIAAW
jgi:hypothetical protein